MLTNVLFKISLLKIKKNILFIYFLKVIFQLANSFLHIRLSALAHLPKKFSRLHFIFFFRYKMLLRDRMLKYSTFIFIIINIKQGIHANSSNMNLYEKLLMIGKYLVFLLYCCFFCTICLYIIPRYIQGKENRLVRL